MPNGESREGLEDVLELEREYLRSVVGRQSLEDMLADLRARVVSTPPEPTPPEPRIKIPKGFTPLHPLIHETERPDEKPEHLLRTDRVRYILRGGETGSSRANILWWGDSRNNDGAIVAYKKLKKESPWVDWGNLYRTSDLVRQTIALTPDIAQPNASLTTPEILVWLRDSNIPQQVVRRAGGWNWTLDGSSQDIMRYRLAGERDESITRV
jgi:hypothetical protein